jgi:hypothetical protein
VTDRRDPATGARSSTPDRQLLVWTIDETAGFDMAWLRLERDSLVADGSAVAQRPLASSTTYRLETDRDFITRRLVAEARTTSSTTTLDLRRDRDGWTVDGRPRPDLDGALDCDLAACPLTNTMPIRRHELHRAAGDVTFLMAFIEVPSLEVVPSRQRYTTIRPLADGEPAIVRYRSDGFESDLEIDADGLVLVYPKLGRRVVAITTARAG